jgi:hypothetical protein
MHAPKANPLRIGSSAGLMRIPGLSSVIQHQQNEKVVG